MGFDQKKILDYFVNLNQIKEGYLWENPKIIKFIQIHYFCNLIDEQNFLKSPCTEVI